MKTYGQGLEGNKAPIMERLEHIQEELMDYIEWLKDALEEDTDNAKD